MEIIQVTTRDTKIISVPKDILVKNDFFKKLLEINGKDDKVYINVNSDIFDKIIEFLTYDNLDIYEPTKIAAPELKKYFDMWDLDWNNVRIFKHATFSISYGKRHKAHHNEFFLAINNGECETEYRCCDNCCIRCHDHYQIDFDLCKPLRQNIDYSSMEYKTLIQKIPSIIRDYIKTKIVDPNNEKIKLGHISSWGINDFHMKKSPRYEVRGDFYYNADFSATECINYSDADTVCTKVKQELIHILNEKMPHGYYHFDTIIFG